eukprot:CAMPEP_0116831616 /NCGR_PEP_ID=MMETSP0418-20121206/5441_1 /TAXON_ID=1158023 /ORGANISM="Astrosyne radiata, Strain 13vi08-1A" /LENGTH=568 /DNA_ID=CAMNT_0004460897 /DNA_START=42 /DNA_END=1749 /DNA_ORIENTATION=-
MVMMLWGWLVLLLSVGCPAVSAFVSPIHQFGVAREHKKNNKMQPSQSYWRQETSNTRLHMFEQLTNALSQVAKSISPKEKMTEKSIRPALRSVRRALLDADVNLGVADQLIDGVKQRSIGTEVITGVSADQQFVKAIYDELLTMMVPIAILDRGTPENPAVILLAGLQGAGKTTAAGKLASYLKEREVDFDSEEAQKQLQEQQETGKPVVASRLPKTNRKVLLAAADVYRPAAITQLEVLGESISVEVFTMGTEANPVEIAEKAVEKAKEEGFDTVIVDTAGRQIIDKDLMAELKNIKQKINPTETLLVVDAMTGQEAATVTGSFQEAVGITGAILTKMDGDALGGAAVSILGVSGKPIKFVGVGERVEDLDPFYPDRMASRILGMGDVVSLVEKAAAEMSDEEAELAAKKMLEQKFDFNDFLKQSQMISNFGSLEGAAKLIPGMPKFDRQQTKDAEVRLKRSETLIKCMTEEERSNPDLLIRDKSARSRWQRITEECGMMLEDGLKFRDEFQQMRKMMSSMQKSYQEKGLNPMDPEVDPMAAVGNRAQRRAMKKKKKSDGGGFKGFG